MAGCQNRLDILERRPGRVFQRTLAGIPILLERCFCAGIDEEDKTLAAIGCGLAVFTKYKCVINANGTNTDMHDALQIIYQESVELIENSTGSSTDNADTKEDRP